MGNWSLSPLHLGPSSFGGMEPLDSFAMESSSSSTLGGGGMRIYETQENVRGILGSFGFKGASL